MKGKRPMSIIYGAFLLLFFIFFSLPSYSETETTITWKKGIWGFR